MELEEILDRLRSMGSPEDAEGMARYGIVSEKVLGTKVPQLRKLAKEIGTNRTLAAKLWDAGYRETRILASMVEDPEQVTGEQMECWVGEFDNWEVCDQCCLNLFYATPFAFRKVFDWAKRKEEFVKRAAFAIIACIAWKDKRINDPQLEQFFPLVMAAATDGRNYVKKAVSWALRQIGKRGRELHGKAVELARAIAEMDSKSARWIAADVLKELESTAIRGRLGIR